MKEEQSKNEKDTKIEKNKENKRSVRIELVEERLTGTVYELEVYDDEEGGCCPFYAKRRP